MKNACLSIFLCLALVSSSDAGDTGGGLRGEYFANMTLSGSPVLTRIDPEVNFDWGSGEIVPGTSDLCSVRWSGQVTAPSSEPYTFYVATDDGARLWVDGKLVIDAWWDQSPTGYASPPIQLEAGRGYTLWLEWYENTGYAVCQLGWSSPSTPQQIIPSSQLDATPKDAVEPGLVGWWRFNEAAGTTAFDSSGYLRHGTLLGSPDRVAGNSEGGLAFDGVADYVDTGFTDNLAAWTVCVWVKSPAAPTTRTDAGPVHWEANFQLNWDHGDPAFQGAAALSVGGAWYPASFGDVQADIWYHWAATYDGETLRAYRDGILITSNEAPSGAADPESHSMKFGRHAWGNEFFTGTIDDVRVYNRALDAAEVSVISKPAYSGGSGTAADPYRIGSVADWQFLISRPIDWGSSFVLTADLDFGGMTIIPVGTGDTYFTGALDGAGHTLSNLKIDQPDSDYVGLFGFVYSGKVKFLGVVNADIRGNTFVGGLIGDNYNGTVTSCYATGTVSGVNIVGGLVGVNTNGPITSCYATGTVTGNGVGGLVGNNVSGAITSCYATGAVTGSGAVGGLVGNNSGSSSGCFWDTQTTGQTTSDGGTGKTTAEMKRQSTFTAGGWDFANVWGIAENQSYPYLRAFSQPAADLNGDGRVDLADFALFAQQWMK